MKHQWGALLLTGLDFNGIKYYIGSRNIVETLISKGIITGQGKKNELGVAEAQQAYWFSRSDFKKRNEVFTEYFEEVKTEKELVEYLNRV